MRTPRRFDPPLRAPATVQEGGTLVIDVGEGVQEVTIAIPGLGARKVRVNRRRVEYRLPQGARGGTPIFVGDGAKPVPYTTTVMIVGNV